MFSSISPQLQIPQQSAVEIVPRPSCPKYSK
jgi:hypothetical protein